MRSRRFAACAAALLAASCRKADPWEGLAQAQETSGPRVVFDPARRPLPEIPFPSDLATREDPSSPTGLRVNSSLAAPSFVERNTRALLDQLDGFGTYAPITVAFDQDLDVLDLYARQNDRDPANDGVYLVDLASGQTVPLDFDGGHFPAELASPGQYFRNDPLAGVTNLLFPTTGPNANFLHPPDPAYPATHGGVAQQSDDLLTFYERSTRTLVIRPVLPLAQERRYAVVLTSRLRGTSGAKIGSPHSGVNHAAQTGELRPLLSKLPAGVQLSDVAYAWAFTTQSTTRDLELIRHGLYGFGPLRQLALQYPLQVGDSVSAGDGAYHTRMKLLQLKGPSPVDPANPSADLNDYIIHVPELLPLLQDPDVQKLLLGDNPQNAQAVIDTYRYVDYFVIGQYESPSFLDAGPGVPQDQSFQIDRQGGIARTQPAVVTFMLAVPKPNRDAGHVAPFPVAVAGHGYRSARLEHVLGFAGSLAKFGLATISIDAYGHGIGVDPLVEKLGRDKAAKLGLGNFADALLQGRARDLDGDGVKDPGADFWSADSFHTRDAVRQSIVDWLQLVRLLRTFDGHGAMFVGGNPGALAGDFNNDGIPDVGGPPAWPFDVGGTRGNPIFPRGSFNPGSDTFVFGISLGGILSGILPAVEPAIVAAAPTSGAGGLADVGLRSTQDGVVQAIYLEAFGPLLATCNWSAQSGPADPQTFLPFGACSDTAPDAVPTLVQIVQDLNRERDVPIARLSLRPGDRVVVKNLAELAPGADCPGAPGSKLDGCSTAVADGQGRLRLPIAADWPLLQVTRTPSGDPAVAERVKVQVTRPGDRLQVQILPAGGGAPVTIDSFQQPARFFGVTYQAGDPLVAVARGYGYARNSPELRRLFGLAQLILDPADPINYAPHYFQEPLPDVDPSEGGVARHPANVLVVATSGDPAVPVNTGIAMARAAGLVELTAPDPVYGIPIDQVLIRGGVVEGSSQLRRFDAPGYGPRADLAGHVRCDGPQACQGAVLLDSTAYACDANGQSCTDDFPAGATSRGAPRLDHPLRQELVRTSQPAAACGPLSKLAPGPGCYSTGASSCRTDPAGNALPGLSALLIPYLNREGQHGFRTPQPGKAFDVDTWLINLIGRFFECRGRELRFDPCQTKLSSATPGGCPWIPPPPP